MSETLQFELVTPERLAVSTKVEMVEVPGEMGDFGVLPGHAPFMSIIRPGVVSVHESAEKTTCYFIPAGYAEVNPTSCTVLAEHIQNLDDISLAEAQKRAKDAELDLRDASEDDREQAEKALMVAEALEYAVQTYKQ